MQQPHNHLVGFSTSTAKEAELQRRSSELYAKEAELYRRSGELYAKEAELHRRSGELYAKEARLFEHIQIKELRAYIQQQCQELEYKEIAFQQQKHLVKAMEKTFSWKITAPLRKVRNTPVVLRFGFHVRQALSRAVSIISELHSELSRERLKWAVKHLAASFAVFFRH